MDSAAIPLPTAQIINLSTYRKPENHQPAEPMFKPTPNRHGLDINQVGRMLEALAKVAAAGTMDRQLLARHMASLGANVVAACRAGHDIDQRAMLAEAVISHQHGGVEGKALKAIIKAEFNKVCRANRAARIAANREARTPKGKRR